MIQTDEVDHLKDPPEPGVYRDVPMEEYHRWNACSNSRLSNLLKSPAHMSARVRQEFEETRAQTMGRMLHKAVLEPGFFSDHYVVLENCQGTTNKGKACTNSAKYFDPELEKGYCGTHATDRSKFDEGPEVVDKDDFEVAEGIIETVRRKQSVSSLLEGSGDVEICAVWEDPRWGITCKARIDRYAPGVPGKGIADFKTTRDASPSSFRRSIFNYGYHRQSSFYLRGMNTLDYDIEHFFIIAAEKEPPYEVSPYRVSDALTEEVEGQLDDLLALYAECWERNEWPGYIDEVQDITIPSWGWDKLEDQRNRTTLLKEVAFNDG